MKTPTFFPDSFLKEFGNQRVSLCMLCWALGWIPCYLKPRMNGVSRYPAKTHSEAQTSSSKIWLRMRKVFGVLDCCLQADAVWAKWCRSHCRVRHLLGLVNSCVLLLELGKPQTRTGRRDIVTPGLQAGSGATGGRVLRQNSNPSFWCCCCLPTRVIYLLFTKRVRSRQAQHAQHAQQASFYSAQCPPNMSSLQPGPIVGNTPQQKMKMTALVQVAARSSLKPFLSPTNTRIAKLQVAASLDWEACCISPCSGLLGLPAKH